LGWHEFRRSPVERFGRVDDSAARFTAPASGTRTCTGRHRTANSPFTPLDTAGTSNDNLFFTGTPGTVFNPATGLGVPNLGQVKSLFDK